MQNTGLNARVEVAPTAEAALALVRRQRVGVVVSRLHDPDRSGFELAAEIAGDEALKYVRVIATADDVEPSEAALLEQLGVAGVLLRPISSQKLADVLVKALPTEVTQSRLAG